jgi:hypothetical protein
MSKRDAASLASHSAIQGEAPLEFVQLPIAWAVCGIHCAGPKVSVVDAATGGTRSTQVFVAEPGARESLQSAALTPTRWA